jgi:hypothetical protein
LRRLLDGINFDAKSDIFLKVTTIPGSDDLRYTAEFNLLDGSFVNVVNFNNIIGNIIIKGALAQSGNYLSGSAKFSQLKVENKVINNLSLRFLQEKDRISFYDIKGNSYNGAVSGYLVASSPLTSSDSSEAYHYQGKVALSGIDLKEFGRDTFLSTKELIGRLSTELEFTGIGASLESLNGSGRLFINNAQLWEVPVFLSIYNLFTLRERSPFHDGEMKFTVTQNKMNIKRLIFNSKDVILKGKGEVNLKDGNVNLRVDAQFTKSIIPNIPIVKEIKDLITKGIYTIEIKGPFTDPKAEIKPLPILDIFK